MATIHFIPAQPFVESTTLSFINKSNDISDICAQYYNHEISKASDQEIIIVPDGVIDILFKISGNGVDIHVCGAVKKATPRMFERGCSYFGVRFKPGAANQLLKCPLNTLTEGCVNCEDLLANIHELKDAFFASSSFEERIVMFNQYLQQNITEQPRNSSLTAMMIQHINSSKGDIKMKELSTLTHYTPNYLYKRFSKEMGVSPKHYARVVRFQHCLDQFRHVKLNRLTDIALESGYYDQAHFINEFKEFSSFTPSQLHELKN